MKQKELFDGLSEPNLADDAVRVLDAEEFDLPKLIAREKLREQREDKDLERQEKRVQSSFKRKIAGRILLFSFLAVSILILAGLYKDDFRAAYVFWAFAGPLVGYSIREIFDGRKTRDQIGESPE